MAGDLLIIAITRPDRVEGEADRISRILKDRKADFVHIRKPSWSEEETEALIEEIPIQLHSRIKLHDHFRLLDRFRLAGVHLNARNPIAPQAAYSISISMHSAEQLPYAKHYDYVTLSPIFDSISKPSYRSAFRIEDLSPLIKGKRVVALGGVTPDKLGILRDAGFFGAAMLGHFWSDDKNKE